GPRMKKSTPPAYPLARVKQPRPLGLELVVGQEPGPPEILELAQVLLPLELVALLGKWPRAAFDADRVGIDPGLGEALAETRDPEPARRQPHRLGAGDRPLLDEAAVRDDEQGGDADRGHHRHEEVAAGLRADDRGRDPPPTSDPVSPMKIVSHAGIGSGPGTAQRASPPMANPSTTA